MAGGGSDLVLVIWEMLSLTTPSPSPFLLAIVQKINFVPAAAGNIRIIQVLAGQLLACQTTLGVECLHAGTSTCGQLWDKCLLMA